MRLLFVLGLLIQVGAYAVEQSAAPVQTVSDAKASIDEKGIDYLKLRDPFKPPTIELAVEKAKSPLETFSADQFKMVGVVTGPDRIKAMLLGPDGKSYFVHERSHIGIRKGIVKRIEEDSVLVIEKIPNELGSDENIETVLRLPEEKKVQSGGSNGG